MLKEAQDYCGENQARNDDIIQAGMLGLAEAIDRFDSRRNNGLAAFAKPYIRGRMQATAKALTRNGWSGETRLQRLVRGDHDVTLERASEVVGRPVAESELEDARGQVLGMHSEPLEYNTREPAFDDEYDEEGKPGIVAPAPICTLQRIHKHHSELVEWYAEDTDGRAKQRLKEIGRRAYALELVERDHARLAARSEPTQYLYRTDTKIEVRARIAAQIDQYKETEVPTVRRYADRSFNSEHVFLKKRPPEYWPSVYPTWGASPRVGLVPIKTQPAALAA